MFDHCVCAILIQFARCQFHIAAAKLFQHVNVSVDCCHSSQLLQLFSKDTSPQRSPASCSELRLVATGNDFDHADVGTV